jgi:glutamate dehydrogenase
LALAEQRASGEPVVRVETAPDGGIVIETVTDDMPFLVAALLAAIARAGGEVRRVLHPIVVVRRTPDGKLADVLTRADPDAPPPDALAESWTRLELAPLGVPADKLQAKLTGVLRDVREIVADAQPMHDRALEIADTLASQPASPGATPPSDVASLLRWLVDGHLTFLGYRHHVAGPDGTLCPDSASGLGMLRDGTRGGDIGAVPDEPGGRREPLVITRANAPSPLKPVHPYYLAVPTFDGEGRRTGEHRFLGTLTVPALYESVLDIPVVERRVRGAIHRAGFPLESYSGPADARSDLRHAARGAVQRHGGAAARDGGRRARRRRPGARCASSCAPTLPPLHLLPGLPPARPVHDVLPTCDGGTLRRRLGGSSVEYTARVSESRLALVHFTVRRTADAVGYAGWDVAGLQDELTEVVRTWDDRFLSEPGGACARRAARRRAGGVQGHHAARAVRWRTSPGSPRWRVPVDFSVRLCPADGPADRRFTLYLASTPATLTDMLPLLQQLGLDVLDERPSEFERADGLRVHVYDFSIRLDDATRTALDARPRRTSSGSSARRSARRGAATSRPTGSPPSCSARACRGARRRCCGPTPATPARSARRTASSTWRTPCSLTPTSPAGCWRSSAPGSTRGSCTATRRSRTPSPTCAPASTPSPGWTPTASCAASSR